MVTKYLPPSTTPAVDLSSGLMTSQYYQFLLNLYDQTGKGAGNNSDSFKYPNSAGNSGQILTSQGGSAASIWNDQLSKVSQLSNDSQFVTATALADYVKKSELDDYAKLTDLSGYAPLESPAFTGAPTAPTAAPNNNTVQVATTGYVLSQAAVVNPNMDGTVAIGSSFRYARQDHVHPVDTSRAAATNAEITGLINLHSINAVISILPGTGSPDTVVTATKGSIFIRTDGSSGTLLYVCTGGSAWTAFA